MYSLAGALISVWASLSYFACSVEDGVTMQKLQETRLWNDDQTTLILTQQAGLPGCYLKALEEAIKGSNVHLIEIACPAELSGDENACPEYLKDSTTVAVRTNGTVKVMDDDEYNSVQEFVLSVLELLLSPYIAQFWSYTDLTEYSGQHSQYLLALSPDSEEYSALLSALLVWPMPLAVAMTSSVLPLSQRYQYSAPPTLLQLWYVVEGQGWYSNLDTTGFNLHVVQRCKTPRQLIREFVERVHSPIVIDYKDDITVSNQFADSGLHLALLFPSLNEAPANESEPTSLAVRVAQKTFMNYAFIVMPNRSRMVYFVRSNDPSPHMIVLPYGSKHDQMAWPVDRHHLSSVVQRIIYTLRAYAVMHPRIRRGYEIYPVLGPSFEEVHEITQMIAEGRRHIFAYFCLKGQQQCAQVGFKVVREVLSVLRVTELGKSLGAHVIFYKSKNAKPFKLKNLITCALYNHTSRAWSVADRDITSGSQALHFIGQVTGLKELEEVARVMLHLTLTLADVPPPPKPLQEDDPLNLVADSLPHPTLPKEIQLTSSTFHQHISKFSKTTVVFCIKWSVRCNVFLHHLAAAHEQLNTDLNISLSTVACNNYTELCSKYHVSSYPTVLLFTPTTLHAPTPIGGILDSAHLLSALGQAEDKKQSHSSLVELTPESLPALLPELSATLVLWCDGEVNSDKAEVFTKQATHTHHPNLTFAWMNSNKHQHLLSHIIPTSAKYPAVVAINFKKHSVHLLSMEATTLTTFKEHLATFLEGLTQGSLEPSGHLGDKEWLPLQPSIPFPSTTNKKRRQGSHQQPTTTNRKETPPTHHHTSTHNAHTEL